ncbi:hypothetical protein [Alterisphingorhabdus coralli]|uniref:Uncharacterized protein n=1 Tax=Alterisphingorhabdus coralli TaxID=3071408 RepID=A0AA97F4F1_9SPHN|nr:hypothetical protein [Parasphingorhabdus sp. SCSIO 66989]WOE73843.1 hypothetical protein RB602_08150 [Parasphingorhabdus sp. SCSIO 66989]
MAIFSVGIALVILTQDAFTPLGNHLSDEVLADIKYGIFLDQILLAVLFLAPSLWWHLVDHFENIKTQFSILAFLVSYSAFISVTIIALIGSVIVVSGVTALYQCRDAGPSEPLPDGTQFYTLCDPISGYGIEYLVIWPILILFMLAALKTATHFSTLLRSNK